MRSEKPAVRSMLRQSAVVISLLCRHKAVVKPSFAFCEAHDELAPAGSPASGKNAFAPLNRPMRFDTLTTMLLSSFFPMAANTMTAAHRHPKNAPRTASGKTFASGNDLLFGKDRGEDTGVRLGEETKGAITFARRHIDADLPKQQSVVSEPPSVDRVFRLRQRAARPSSTSSRADGPRSTSVRRAGGPRRRGRTNPPSRAGVRARG